MKLFDLKIGARVGLAFGVVLLIIALLVAAVTIGLTRSAANSATMSEDVKLQAQAANIHLLLTVELVGICTAILVVVGIVSSFVPAVR